MIWKIRAFWLYYECGYSIRESWERASKLYAFTNGEISPIEAYTQEMLEEFEEIARIMRA